jgi:hypothetical protein
MCECAAMRLSPRSSLLSAMVVMGYMLLVIGTYVSHSSMTYHSHGDVYVGG